MNKATNYFDAAMYAYQVLGVAAPKYLARLQQLAQYNSSEELHAIIDCWCPKDALTSRPAPKAPAPDLWTAGSQWGSAVRVARNRGIIWKLKCQCGKNFELSTNDTTPEHLRKCPTCILADEFSETKKEFVSRLDETSKIVLEWHRAHDKLIWNRVHKACAKRGITSADWSTIQFKKELHALSGSRLLRRSGSIVTKASNHPRGSVVSQTTLSKTTSKSMTTVPVLLRWFLWLRKRSPLRLAQRKSCPLRKSNLREPVRTTKRRTLKSQSGQGTEAQGWNG